MRITYLKLENIAGLYVGGNRDCLEISFEESKNKIIAIRGVNSSGKTTVLSSLHPFASVTTLDERSTLSYVMTKKNGYKEIHYQDGEDTYICKHYFKSSGNSHTVKSYFIKNGEELNENGNVTSFDQLVEIHMGLTKDMMRLIRIGSNVNSFISLTPARRKEYIGKLIEDIDLYLIIYKKINDDLKVVHTLIQTNTSNLYNCHINDLVVEEDHLKEFIKLIREKEKERDKIVSRLSKIELLMKDNDIDKLKQKRSDAASKLNELDDIEDKVKSLSLETTTLEDLIKERSNLSNDKINIQSKINSYRISIDTALRNIERLEISIKKITSDNDIQSLINTIENIRASLKSTSSIVKSFTPGSSNSEEVHGMISRLQSFNQISQMIYTFGNKPIDIYLKVKSEVRSVDKWLREQAKKKMNGVKQTDLQYLFDKLFDDESIISPNCDTEYMECPFFKLSEVITEMKDNIDTDNYDDETLRYIQIISNNIDNMLNELDRMYRVDIPSTLRDIMIEKNILGRMKDHLPFFDLSSLQEYLSILKDYEIYTDNCNKLKQYEYQLSVYKKSGVESHMSEISSLRESINNFNSQIRSCKDELIQVDGLLENVDNKIGLITKYNDGKKYKNILKETLDNTTKILEPLETASSERNELGFQLRQITDSINLLREQHHSLEMKISEYKKLLEESEKLTKIKSHLDVILESVGTKKGIPVFYMNKYLKKIQKLANNLLSLIYDDKFKLAKFNVSPDSFEVPYIKNGKKIPDIKYASQSERAMSTMALSFALANNASGKYNIPLLDEVDAGLDEINRIGFIKMLYNQMVEINAEQVFIISQNISHMVNIPMDSIRLSEIDGKNKLENIIYE